MTSEDNPLLIEDVPQNNDSVNNTLPDYFLYGFLYSSDNGKVIGREDNPNFTDNDKFLERAARFTGRLNNDDIAEYLHEHSKTRLTRYLFLDPYNKNTRVTQLLLPHYHLSNDEQQIRRAFQQIGEFVNLSKEVPLDAARKTDFSSEICLRSWVNYTYNSLIFGDIDSKTKNIDNFWSKKAKNDRFRMGYSVRELIFSLDGCIDTLNNVIDKAKMIKLESVLGSTLVVARTTQYLCEAVRNYFVRTKKADCYDKDLTACGNFFSTKRGLGKGVVIEGGVHAKGHPYNYIFDVTYFLGEVGLMAFTALYLIDAVLTILFRATGTFVLSGKQWIINLNDWDYTEEQKVKSVSKTIYWDKQRIEKWNIIKKEVYMWRMIINTFIHRGMEIVDIGKTLMVAICINPEIIPLYNQYIVNVINKDLSDFLSSIYFKRNEILELINSQTTISAQIDIQLLSAQRYDQTLKEMKDSKELKAHFAVFPELKNTEPLMNEIKKTNKSLYSEVEYYHFLKNLIEERSNKLIRLSNQLQEDIAKERKKSWWQVLIELFKEFRYGILAITVLIFGIAFSGPISSILNFVAESVMEFLRILKRLLDRLFS